jgi:hypothetical protein
MSRSTTSALIAILACSGCGGAAAFTNLFPDNKPEHIDVVLETVGEPSRTTETRNSTGTPLVAAVVDGGQGVAAWEVQGAERLWSTSLAADSEPAVGRSVVMVRSGPEVVALDLETGERRWSRKLSHKHLYGFAFDAGLVFVTEGNTDGGFAATGQRGVVSALDEESGRRKWSVEVDRMIGAPAARGGLVLIPWDRQSISALDADTGEEVARLLRRDGTVDWVVARAEGVYYGGQKEIIRLTPRAAAGTTDATAHIDFDPMQMPGQPAIRPDAFERSMADPGARARIRLLWSPAPVGSETEMEVRDGSIYFLFYRYLIALGVEEGLARWVHMSEKPVAWAAAGTGGVFLVDEKGLMTYVDGESGGAVELGSLGAAVTSCDFDTGGWSPEVDGEARKLIWGLRDLVFDVDTQVLPLRKYALELMVALPDPSVTMDLLEVMRSSYVPKAMKDQAALMLREREGGVDFLKDALKYHADYLEEMDAPPVGAIASSLAKAGEKSALPLLLSHLRDHETDAGDLEELTAAIIELGDVSVVPELSRFLVMYHADSSMNVQMEVLINVAEAIVEFGGDAGRQFVEELANDGFTPAVLRQELLELAQ